MVRSSCTGEGKSDWGWGGETGSGEGRLGVGRGDWGWRWAGGWVKAILGGGEVGVGGGGVFSNQLADVDEFYRARGVPSV